MLWRWRYPAGAAFAWTLIVVPVAPFYGILAVIPFSLLVQSERRAELTFAALLGTAAGLGVRIVVEWMFGPIIWIGPFDPR
jgi:hypothetical protein